MTPAALTSLRTKAPDCDLALYADIASGTVLAAEGRLDYPQEVLDALCDCATLVLSGPAGPGVRTTEEVIFATPTGIRLFLRAPAHPAEALACVGAPNCDMAALLHKARAALAEGM